MNKPAQNNGTPPVLLSRRDVQEFVLTQLTRMHADYAVVKMVVDLGKDRKGLEGEMNELNRELNAKLPELDIQVKVLEDYIAELRQEINQEKIVSARVAAKEGAR